MLTSFSFVMLVVKIDIVLFHEVRHACGTKKTFPVVICPSLCLNLLSFFIHSLTNAPIHERGVIG